ncbi:kinase-like protein [Polyporus arcularius HHB13444]|uniref:non-specific serine/threonine protein kinase n=1 Tax=Polyporus arcularius HHB13444 TaxID=1314778 RepID=A0A5C3NQ02_9APHY|nr:kinase-like protein [Polyporus arcularius HHB13444]
MFARTSPYPILNVAHLSTRSRDASVRFEREVGEGRVRLRAMQAACTMDHGRVLDDRDPPKLVAVKKCHVTDHDEHPRLQHEACALILLQGHQAIPDVYAWGKSQFYEYLALELLDTDFSDVKGKLTLRNLVAVVFQVLDGLEHVHSRGIVHYCDIKPSNLMVGLDGDGRVRIIDFGICRPYRDPKTLEHRPDKGTPCSLGTSG